MPGDPKGTPCPGRDPADIAAPPPRGRATDAGTLADEAQLLRQLAGKAILLIMWGVVQSHQSLLDHLTVLLPPPSRLHPRPSVLVLAESPIVGLEGCHLSALSPTGCHQLLCNAWPSTTDGHEVTEAVRHYADGDLPLFHFLARAIAALCPSPSDSEASSPGVAEIIHWLRSAPGVEGPRGWLGHAMDHLLPRLVPDAHQEAVGSLVVFPPEVPLPVDMLRKYWGWCRDRWSDFDVQTFLERLCSLGLLRCVTRSAYPGSMLVPQFSVPAWLGAYLATRYSPLPWHRVVYDGYAALCESVGDWDSVPDDGYFYQHFPHHCAALGQPAPRPHWRRALLPSVSLTGLELAALLAALPAPDAAALVASLCFLAVRAPSSEQRLHTQRTLASCFGEAAVYEGVWRQLRSCATPGDVAAFLRCLPNVSGAEVDVVADLALYGAATPAPGVQQMVRSLFRRGYDAGPVNEGLTVALQRLAESPAAAAEPTAFLLAALVPPADAAVPPGLLAAVLGHALGASPAPGPAAQAAQAFLRQCRGSRLLFDRLLPMLDEDLPGEHTITAQVLECLPSLTDLAGSAAIDQVVCLAFEARAAACAAAARRLLRRSPGREYVARAVSHAVERAIAEGPARAEQDALAVALAALPEGSANAVSPAVAQYLLQLATAAEGSVPVTLAHQAQQLLVTTAQCSAAYHAIGEWKGEEAARQVQVLVSRCLDLHLHPPAATQLPVLFALAVSDGDGGAAGAAAEAQGQLRRLSGHAPEPLKQLHGLVQEALSNILFSPAVEGPRRTVRAINCLACLSTLHTAPPPLVQMVLELHAGQTLQSPGLHAMATRLLLTCEGPELDWQRLLPPDFDTGPGEELRALLPALLRHPDEAYAAQALVRLTTQHTDPSVRGAAQALLPAVPDQTLVAQRLYDVLRAHAPQTAAEVIMAADHGDSLAPDAVLQNALDAWPRLHIAGTASLEMLDAALRLALHAPLEATSAAARAVLRHCPGVTHVYRQLAAHLSLVHSNGALLHRALQSFPNLTFAEDEVLDQVWQIALRHHSPAVCDAARALLRTCAGHLHVYRLVTQLLDQDGDDRAGAVAAEDLCCALDSCPPLTVADESTFHAVLLRVQSPHAAVQRAARCHFREVDPAAGPAAVVHVCGQLTRVLRCLGDLGLHPGLAATCPGWRGPTLSTPTR